MTAVPVAGCLLAACLVVGAAREHLDAVDGGPAHGTAWCLGQEAMSSSIWLIASEEPSMTPMSSTCWSASAEA